jgi:hypothetical protein
MKHLVSLRLKWLNKTKNQKPFEQPTQKAFLSQNTEGPFNSIKVKKTTILDSKIGYCLLW